MDALSQIAEIVRLLIAKLSSLFDVIDLSFFVSGGTCMLAFVYMRYVYVSALPDLSGALAFAIAILGSYVMGLLCFAIGRWLRRLVLGRPWTIAISDHMESSLGLHGLERDIMMSAYLRPGAKRRDALYPRLWAELRQEGDLKPSFELIASYWVRAAVYDGLIAALFIWALAIWRTLAEPRGFGMQPEVGYGALVFVAAGILACAREASRSERYQIDEITATMAYANDKRRREAKLRAVMAAKGEGEIEGEIEQESADAALPPPPEVPELTAGTPKLTKVIEPAPEKKGKKRST